MILFTTLIPVAENEEATIPLSDQITPPFFDIILVLVKSA